MEDRREIRDRADVRISALGSGSDYTPFLQHLGIASLNIAYGGEGESAGVYHSIYDSFDHYTKFVDPDFDYGIALAQTAGRMVLRFAGADLLPFEFTNFSDTLSKYVKEVTKLTDDMREETLEKNRRISDRTLEAISDPKLTYVVPKAEEPVPYINFAPLQNALAKLQESSRNYKEASNEATTRGRQLTPEERKSLDEILINTERVLTSNEGLPRRPWFKHEIYAPGFYTGYGVKTLPAVREAIEQRNWKEVDEQMGVVAKAIERMADEIDHATKIVKH
jgi:N-acetylated-alpha-linked acidic dipeptidase